MQTLAPPYPVIDGYALLPDHLDPALWHALPAAPSLAMADGRPQLSLIEYLGGGAGAAKIAGGILQLTTELTIPEDVLAALPGKLAARLGPGKPMPIVVPVGFDTGTVELTVLGRTNAVQPQGSAAPGGPFEVQFVAGGKASLGGANTCTFQLVLNENAAVAIAACLDQPELPVVVSYVMGFSALRPAFTLEIDADWHKIYSTLQNRVTANAWVAAADIDVEVTKALEESGVHVSTIVEGGAEAAADAARTREQLLDWVLDKLFTAMIPAASTAEQVGDAVQDTVWSLTRAIIPGASYKLKAIDQDQLRHLSIRATEQLAEVRELRPQGTLGGLLRRLRVDEDGKPNPNWPAIRAGMLGQIELTAFPRLEVTVSLVDRFGTDGLRTCRVQIARLLPGSKLADSTEYAFTAGTPTQDYIVNLLDDAARHDVWDTPYVYRVIADFDPAAPLRTPAAAISPWRRKSAASLLVDPREAYAVSEVTVTVAPMFSFAAFPLISVDLCPGFETPDPSRSTRISLNAQASLTKWTFSGLDTPPPPPPPAVPVFGFGAPPVAAPVTAVVSDELADGAVITVAGLAEQPHPPGYSWRATYHRPLEAGGDVVSEWSSAMEPWLSLPDPMPEKLQVSFFIDLPWNDVAVALLQIKYLDEVANIRYAEETITLSAATPLLTRLYAIAAGGLRSIDYRLTIKLVSGPLMEGGWRSAADDRIVIDRRLVDQRQVLLKLVGGTLADQHLTGVTVSLQVRDALGQPIAATDLAVQPGAEPGFTGRFEYLRGDPPNTTVFVQVIATDNNGFRRTLPWTSSTSDLLVLDLRTLTIRG